MTGGPKGTASGRFEPGAALRPEVRRLLTGEIGRARESLALARENPSAGVHETRKRFKRIRALLSLVRPADEDFYVIENARYRDLGRTLAPAREAAALVETVDRFRAGDGEPNESLEALRETLAARVPQAGDRRVGLAIDNALAWCDAGAAAAWRFDPDGDADMGDVLASGAKRSLKQARNALTAIRRHGGAEDFHDLRKATKAHAAHLGLLGELWPEGASKRRKHCDALGEELGELNDIHVMRHLVMSSHDWPGGKSATATLLKLLDRRQKQIAHRAVHTARETFGDRPAEIADRIRDAVADAGSGSALPADEAAE